jgi:hypothetical protein
MNRILRNVGFLLLLLGASSFLFPLIGLRSRIMSAFGEHETLLAGIFLGAGALAFALSFRGSRGDKTPPPPPGGSPPPQMPGPTAPA